MSPAETLSPDDAYHASLGLFVEAFALYEANVTSYLRALAGVEPRVLRVFSGGTNVDGKLDLIRRLWRVYPLPEADIEELGEVFTHAKWVTTARNLILHYGTAQDARGERTTTDIWRVLDPADAVVHPVSSGRLLQMASDIIKCAAHLRLAADRLSPARDASLPAAVEAARRRAWLYTPPPESARKSRTSSPTDRTKPPGRLPPPSPSPD